MFYCPRGHPQFYSGEPEVERLRKEAERLRVRLNESEAEAGRARTARKWAEASAKRERTRRRNLEQRARGGLCPCCKRSFVGLARHMKTKHPSFGHSLKTTAGEGVP